MPTTAFLELQRLVRHMTDELASFRRRAFAAEGRVRELEHALEAAEARAGGADGGAGTHTGAMAAAASMGEANGGPPSEVDRGMRLDELERENVVLRHRLDGATERTRQLLDRVRFLRQQQDQEAAR